MFIPHTSRMIANFIVEGPGNVAKCWSINRHALLNEQRLEIMLVVISDVEVAVSRMVCMEAHTRASKVFFPEIIEKYSK